MREFIQRFRRLWALAGTSPVRVPEVGPSGRRTGMSEQMVDLLNTLNTKIPLVSRDLRLYTPPPGVAPASAVAAMDAAMGESYRQSRQIFSGAGFPGFPYLTELTQITEYRDMSERVSAEMCRKWIKLRSQSKQDKSKQIKVIEAAMKRFKVRDLFRYAAIMEGFMGRSQIFVDMGETSGQELETPLLINPYKIQKGSLRGFKVIEPITTYPADYNSSNPLAENYYRPNAWWVYGQRVHASRLLTFLSRPLPDLLKPSYNFSGMSMSQLAEPYVNYWLKTRDSVGKLLQNFSTTILSTDLENMVAESDGGELMRRIRLFVSMRDNQGVFILNKDTETFSQSNVPLSGLDALQAQAQEHMAAVAKTPLPILLGITPSGLNASNDSEIQIFYDYVADQQELMFRANLETVIRIIQFSELGEVDDDIVFDFVSLKDMDESQKATIQAQRTASAAQLIPLGVISPEEERERLANDPDSGYDNLQAGGEPEITGEEDSELGKADMDVPDGVSEGTAKASSTSQGLSNATGAPTTAPQPPKQS